MDDFDYHRPLTPAAREKLKALETRRIHQFRNRLRIDAAGLEQHIKNELIWGRLRDYWACLLESLGTPDDRAEWLWQFGMHFADDDVTVEAFGVLGDSELKLADLFLTYHARPVMQTPKSRTEKPKRRKPRMNPTIDEVCRELLKNGELVQSEPEGDTTGSRRARVNAFLNRVRSETGMAVHANRTDLWQVAGYNDATEFQRWQRGDRRTTAGAKAKFERILRMTTVEFTEQLNRIHHRRPTRTED
jgi:hypothetical protein